MLQGRYTLSEADLLKLRQKYTGQVETLRPKGALESQDKLSSETPYSSLEAENRSVPSRKEQLSNTNAQGRIDQLVDKKSESDSDKYNDKGEVQEDSGFSSYEISNYLAPYINDEALAAIKDNPFSFIQDPIDLLHFIDPAFNKSLETGGRELYEWQTEELLRAADTSYSQKEPLTLNICAANGSGKDAYFIALFAVWHLIYYIRSRCVITSSSFKQIDKQTEPYIRAICSAFNAKIIELGICESKQIICKKGHIICTKTRSEIILFVTDDPEKAEGYHPWPDSPSQKMAIIINEAKSVEHVIFNALTRCTGYTSWMEISSPGVNDGDFYNHCNKAVQYPSDYVKGKRYFRRVTAYDCPRHFSETEIEEKRAELDPELFGSIYLAQFSSVGAKIVISKENIDCLYAKITNGEVPYDGNTKRAGGLDLSLGGDETSLTWRTGNRMDGQLNVRIRDAVALSIFLDGELTRIKFSKNQYAKDGTVILGDPIYTDIGGLGAPIAHILENKGWNIQYVLNNSPSFQKRLYTNRVAEDWFNLRNFINRNSIILKDGDPILRDQLTSRKYSFGDSNRIKLQSKEEAKTDGNRSPDRADSLVLCFCDFVPSILTKERKEKTANIPESQMNYNRISQKDLVSIMDRDRFSKLNNNLLVPVGPRQGRNGWITTLIKEQNSSTKSE